MRCLEREKARAFIDGELSKKAMQRIERHLKYCRICQNQLKTKKEHINFVQTEMKLLDPQIIPKKEYDFLQRKKITSKSTPILKRLILSPIRVPASVLALLGIVILVLSLMLFDKSRMSSEPESIRLTESEIIALLKCAEG